MTGTGRIASALRPSISARIFGVREDPGRGSELELMTWVDMAHLVMLRETGILDHETTRAVLAAIDDLRRAGYTPLLNENAPRGLFLLYESWLMERLGPELGGVLQTARSRNDLNATMCQIRLRRPYRAIVLAGLRLEALLANRARSFSGVVMPVFTHSQAALPITLGHYFCGIADALGRDLSWLLDAGTALDTSPLGAGAAAGTSLPIDPSRTAHLLGFVGSQTNSLDAVASRDAGLRIVAGSACLAVTISRLASDLLSWLGSTQRFLTLPDDLVGSSSLMPQKRNPFLLEHVLGSTAQIPSVFTGIAAAMHGTPFTNTIAVGTEAMEPVEGALDRLVGACALTHAVTAAVQPDPERMEEVAEQECTTSTELANRLIRTGKFSFRQAHHEVGRVLTELEQDGGMSIPAAALRLLHDDPEARRGLDAASVAAAGRFGGGPAPETVIATVDDLDIRRREQAKRLCRQIVRWDGAEELLREAVEEVLDGR